MELEDKSPNSLMREGREERGEGGGGVGGREEAGEVRSMTSCGFVHSSLGTICTPLHMASLLHPRLSSSNFSISMASKMMWRLRERVGSLWQRSMRLKTLSSFWRRRSMKVRVYWKEAELKRVEDIVRGFGFQRKLVGLVVSVR